MSYFSSSSSSYQRRNVPHPIITLPETPPTSPDSEKETDMPGLSPSFEVAHRHSYANASPTVAVDTTALLASPLTLPSLLHDDTDSPPFSVLTPNGSPNSRSVKIAEQQAFNLLTSLSDPRGFPLLPPHHPLRKKLYGTPPTTPKGHPLELGSSFPFHSPAKMHVISNPYAATTPYTTLGYLLRIPRRLRPFVLAAVCFFTFTIIYMNRAWSQANDTERVQPSLGRRYTHIEGLVGINSRHQAVHDATVYAHDAGAVIQAPLGAASIEFKSTEEELLALVSFITSTSSNILPPLDPALPLEPAAVLDFDPTRQGAREDLELLMDEINTLYPVILLGKMRDPWHREIKKMLAEFKITPAPLVIDIDQRRDHLLFVPLVQRLLGSHELPQLLLQGKSLGSYHTVLSMRDAGSLRSTLEQSGAVSIREAKIKKKGLKERERVENERVLGPSPIME